jgi:hypothetical protein
MSSATTIYKVFFWTPEGVLRQEDYTSRSSALMRAHEFESANRSVRVEEHAGPEFNLILQFVPA